MLLDISPLKISRDYRLLFFGQLVSFFGSMMTFIVVPWQMFQLTKSSAMVGYLYLAEFVPMVCLAFVGGALADALDKRDRADERHADFADKFASAESADLDFVCGGRAARRVCGDSAPGV